jgi:hypothetical protein
MSEIKVESKIKIVPERRSATYDVALGSDDRRAPIMRATVSAKTISFAGLSDIPKTLEAADAIAALAAAVRAELETQGITE